MRLLVVWLLACVTACGGGDGGGSADAGTTTTDGGPDEPDAFVPFAIAVPLLPANPVLTPCPAGWSERLPWRSGAPVTCEPWPADRIGSCSDAFERFPETAGCSRIGSTCPADGWPADLPADGVLYVAGGASGGDGTRALPFATIDDALAVATPGTIVALSTGEHEARVVLGDGIELRGACPDGTTLRTPPEGGTTISSSGTGARVTDLRITGPGEGIRAMTGTLSLAGVLIEGATLVGIVAREGSEVNGESVVIRRMEPSPVVGLGIAVAALGGQVTLSRAVVDQSREFGFLVGGPAAGIALTDAAVRNTLPTASGEIGVAIAVAEGARASLARSVVEHSLTGAISVSEPATVLELDHVLVRNTDADRLSGDFGVGITIFEGASATIRRTVCETVRTAGISIHSTGELSSVVLSDVLVRDVATELSTGERGYGIGALQATHLEAQRVLVERTHTAGVSVYGGADALIEDLQVFDVRPGGGIAGNGIAVEDRGTLTLVRGWVEQAHEVGISVFDQAALDAEDLTVRRTRSRLGDGTWGRGINVQDGALTLARARIEDALEVGLFAHGPSSTVSGTDVSIVRTHERDCASIGCPEGPHITLGNGLVSVGAARISLSRFEVLESDLVGVQIGADATMDLDTGLVAENAIGLNLQNPALDVARLSRGVTYRDNDLSLDATALPTPAPN